jgi:hypothetical protein
MNQMQSLAYDRERNACLYGSTVIAYGAMSLPLTAADLLRSSILETSYDRYFMRRSIQACQENLATETESNSGALDGEIQKT